MGIAYVLNSTTYGHAGYLLWKNMKIFIARRSKFKHLSLSSSTSAIPVFAVRDHQSNLQFGSSMLLSSLKMFASTVTRRDPETQIGVWKMHHPC